MARLPTPGGDKGTWGDLLNEYLTVTHEADGTLKASAISSKADTSYVDTQLSHKLDSGALTDKGDLLVHDGTTVTKQAVGANGQVLVADDSQSTGLKWEIGVPLAQANHTPSHTPLPLGATAQVGTLSVAARADHIHPIIATGATGAIFGVGTVDAVFDGTTTVGGFTRSGSVYSQAGPGGIYNLAMLRNVTVNSGITVDMSGIPLVISGTLTNNGTIIHNGPSAVSSTSPGTTSGYGNYARMDTAGGAGTIAAGVAGGGANNTFVRGSAGAAGGTGSNGAGGGAAALPDQRRAFLNSLNTRQTMLFYGDNNKFGPMWGGSGGGSGGGDGSNMGGAGGSGGGVVCICANKIINNGTIAANGGNGYSPTVGNCGGGGGGGGGVVMLTAIEYTNNGAVQANGGIGGSGSGSGTSGHNGNVGVIDVWVIR